LLSFREYLHLKTDIEVEPINIFDADLEFLKSLKGINILKLFGEYLESGIRPIYYKGEYCEKIKKYTGKNYLQRYFFLFIRY
jgi:predicted AAA+ superfamily ATPase